MINKVELFEYSDYITKPSYQDDYYINRAYIEYLKLEMIDKLFLWPFSLVNSLKYIFNAENHSKIYLAYNNFTIFNITDVNHEIFLKYWDMDDYLKYNIYLNPDVFLDYNGVRGYLNFSQIPYVYDGSSTIKLTDVVIVKLTLNYNSFLEWLEIEQYIFLDKNFQILLIIVDASLSVV